MPRELNHLIQDILESSEKISRYISNVKYDDFIVDDIRVDAVIRNLEIIGEAIKNIPDEFKKDYPQIEWKKIARLRDILIHIYFGVDLQILWEIITAKIPELKDELTKLKK
jgi:uncharacterized protein with HEPN domain